MPATTPDQIRRGLTAVTVASLEEVSAVVLASQAEAQQRSALFLATPLIVSRFLDASSALALDWYDELRALAGPRKRFTPLPITNLRESDIGNTVAWATDPDANLSAKGTLTRLAPFVQREVAAGFWDTITGNTKRDPAAVGWQRFARANGCPFCRMLSDKGAVYRANTATFAAHRSCHCVAAPAFAGTSGPEASVEQYVASSKRRSEKDKARLRDYLKENYGA